MQSLRGQQMFNYISPVYPNSNIEQAIYEAIGSEFDNIDSIIDDILLQLFPQTATWGLAWWEQRVGLPTNLNEDIDNRRKKVITKMQIKWPITPLRMAEIINTFTDATVQILENVAPYTFGVTLITEHNFTINLKDIAETIETIKPSHLGYSLNLETKKTINISTSEIAVLNPLNMCGDFYCGDGIVINNYGRSYLSSIAAHADYNKNIKNYDLTGTIVSSINPDNESGIATIGRAYSANENIKASESHLYDTQLSKNDVSASIVGSISTASLQIQGTRNDTIKDYVQTGAILSSKNVDGESGETTMAKIYGSTIQENSDKTNSTKEYNQAGDILASTEVVL